MKHKILVKGEEIKFSIKSCRKCGEVMCVMINSVNTFTCIECMDSKTINKSYDARDVKFFKGKTNKGFIKDWKNGKYEKVKFVRKGKRYCFRDDFDVVI